jgi:hypothetical protein
MAHIQNLLQEISLLSSTSATLGWDQETYSPTRSVVHRAKQLAYLQGKIHKLQTSDEFCEGLASLDPANQRELTHRYERATKLPQELVERDSETSSLAKAAWSEAREKNESLPTLPSSSKSPVKRLTTGASKMNPTTLFFVNTNVELKPAKLPPCLNPLIPSSQKSPPPLLKNHPSSPPIFFTAPPRSKLNKP